MSKRIQVLVLVGVAACAVEVAPEQQTDKSHSDSCEQYALISAQQGQAYEASDCDVAPQLFAKRTNIRDYEAECRLLLPQEWQQQLIDREHTLVVRCDQRATSSYVRNRNYGYEGKSCSGYATDDGANAACERGPNNLTCINGTCQARDGSCDAHWFGDDGDCDPGYVCVNNLGDADGEGRCMQSCVPNADGEDGQCPVTTGCHDGWYKNWCAVLEG